MRSPSPDGAVRRDELLAQLIARNPVAIVVMNDRFAVQYCNASFERLFGYSERDIVGQPVDALIAAGDEEDEASVLARRVLAGEALQSVSRRRRSDGVVLDVEVTAVPIVDAAGTTVGAYGMYQDVTDQVRTARHLALQHAVMRSVAEAETLDDSARRILAAIGSHQGWAVGALWLVQPGGGLRCVAAWQAPGVDASPLIADTQSATFAAGDALPGRAISSGEPIWVPDVASEHLFRAEAATAAGLHAAVAFPIRIGEQILGAFEFFSLEIRKPDPELLETISTISAQLAAFMQRHLAEDQLGRFFGMSLDLLCIAGFDGYFKRLNSSWERALGHTQDVLMSQPYLSFVHPDDLEATMRQAQQLAAGAVTISFENRYRCADGTFKWLMWNAMADPEQELVYAVARDHTQRKQSEQQMREALQMKSDFVSFATHQLRTPLAGIKWMLELWNDAGDRAEADSYVRDARESADRLIALVNDLLDVSRLESGKLQVRPQPVDVVALSADVIREVATLVQEKGQALVFEEREDVPVPVADPQLLRQAILNLISNAIKYTPPGGRIDVEVSREHDNLLWRIRDTGIGIPEPSRARLFEKFYRADNATVVDTEGTGLGLYLVRLIVERFEGRVACESAEGQGTAFMFTLPVTPDGIPSR